MSRVFLLSNIQLLLSFRCAHVWKIRPPVEKILKPPLKSPTWYFWRTITLIRLKLRMRKKRKGKLTEKRDCVSIGSRRKSIWIFSRCQVQRTSLATIWNGSQDIQKEYSKDLILNGYWKCEILARRQIMSRKSQNQSVYSRKEKCRKMFAEKVLEQNPLLTILSRNSKLFSPTHVESCEKLDHCCWSSNN